MSLGVLGLSFGVKDDHDLSCWMTGYDVPIWAWNPLPQVGHMGGHDKVALDISTNKK